MSAAYAQAALDQECARLAWTTSGRNQQLNASAFSLGQLVGAGVLDDMRSSNTYSALRKLAAMLRRTARQQPAPRLRVALIAASGAPAISSCEIRLLILCKQLGAEWMT